MNYCVSRFFHTLYKVNQVFAAKLQNELSIDQSFARPLTLNLSSFLSLE